ncbi:MAG: MBL fold metallo-hydrolase [Fibrobacterota bacterium]
MNSIIPLPYNSDNYAYLAHTNAGSILFDCGNAVEISAQLEKHNVAPDWLVITHEHSDHTAGVSRFLQMYPTCIQVTPRNIHSHRRLTSEVEILHTPGHSDDDVSLYLPNLQAVITGDTLFPACCGRCFTQKFTTLCKSLQKLAALPDQTRIFPGHEYLERNIAFVHSTGRDTAFYTQRLKDEFPSCGITLADELQYNPFMQAAATGDCREFTRLRRAKDTF